MHNAHTFALVCLAAYAGYQGDAAYRVYTGQTGEAIQHRLKTEMTQTLLNMQAAPEVGRCLVKEWKDG